KLIDLGLARDLHPLTGRADNQDLAGTLRYLPPEAWPAPGGGKQQTPVSDLYSLGATLCEMIGGRKPYPDIPTPDLREVDDCPLRAAHRERCLAEELPDDLDLPPAVRQVLTRATACDPARRFQSAGQFLDALRAARARAPGRRRRTSWLALALGLALAAAW